MTAQYPNPHHIIMLLAHQDKQLSMFKTHLSFLLRRENCSIDTINNLTEFNDSLIERHDQIREFLDEYFTITQEIINP